MRVAFELRRRLMQLELIGLLRAKVIVVPVANPIGLGQVLQASHLGRFHLGTGQNFNRGFADLARDVDVAELVAEGGGAAALKARIRSAFAAHCAAAAAAAGSELDGLRLRLLQHACAADIVLDLHCCFDASRHLFTLPSQAERFKSLSSRLNCVAVLTAEVSGGNSFDEACSLPWNVLAARYPQAGFDADTCLSCTVELGGMADTEPEVAAASCEAILAFLWENGCIAQGGGPNDSDFPAPPPATCDATPLAAVHEVMPPHAGVVSFMVGIGERVRQGQPLFQVCDPVSETLTTVCSPADGCMYNRERLRFAQPGLWICKVASLHPIRSGRLLTD